MCALTLFIVMETLQELKELLLVSPQDRLNLWRLLRVRHEDFENMERFELDVLALVAQEIHHKLQVRLIGYIARHDVEIRSIQQDFAKQLQRLSLRHVVL